MLLKTFKSSVVIASLLPCICLGSGFAIIEHSASGLGQSFAGASAVAEDPSTVFFNPAGMMYLSGTQLTTGMHIINPSSQFTNINSTANFAGQVNVALGSNEGGDAGGYNFVPNAYYVQDFGNSRFGLGINSPVGLSLSYANDWIGRYASTKSDLKTVNLNPSFATKLNEQFQFGVGLNIQYAQATLDSKSYFCGHPQLTPTCNPANSAHVLASDLNTRMKGDDWSLGFNAGIIFEPSDNARVGLSYRSKVKHTLAGKLNSNTQTGTSVIDYPITAGLTVPDTLALSVLVNASDKLTVLADVTYTGWSSFKQLKVDLPNGTSDITPENWSDAMRYSLGLKYRYSSDITLRTGVALDKTPVDDLYRTSRIPGDNRTWFSLGASYKLSKGFTVDVAYAHIWVANTQLNESFDGLNGAMQGSLVGSYKGSVDILSAQATWCF